MEEVVVCLSGGAPWGFRLQGGVEHQRPLQVAKVRKRSKACRAGLREADELIAVNEQPCSGLSHAQAMNLIDSIPGVLHIRIKRTPVGFTSVVLLPRAPSPRIDREYRAALRGLSPHHAPVRRVHGGRSSLGSGLTSPPGSEAYYGETDSDADVALLDRQRRQKRRSPSNSTPGAGKPCGRASPEGGETSEMSGYDSAPDACPGAATAGGERGMLPGVTRREVVYQPPPGVWSSQTSTETSSIVSSSAEDQGPGGGGPEEDSGFLEAATVVPLVSPERAKEALMLGSRRQLVPMVGPLDAPLDEELTTTYREKAKQAKLNRGDTQTDKQVKEARTKCRTIASLLTDAPNPHSKGVLMFKKRRQRSKKYTLTSFGSVDEDRHQEDDEDGAFLGSESEFDEEGFSPAPDPTWDSDYLDMLERRAAGGASRGADGPDDEDAPLDPGLSDTAGKGAQLFEQQRKRAAEHARKVAAAQPAAAPHPQVLSMPQQHASPHAEALSQTQQPTSQSMQEQPRMHPHVQAQPVIQMQPLMQPQMHQPMMQMQQPQMQQPQMQQMQQPQLQSQTPPSYYPQSMVPASTTPCQDESGLVAALPGALAAVPSHLTADDGLANLARMPSPSLGTKSNMTPATVLALQPPPAQTPLPDLPSSSVLNRTARPFAPGFVSSRSATAPVVFRPTVSKKPQRPATSAAAVSPPFSTAAEMANLAPFTSLGHLGPSSPQAVFSPLSSMSGGSFSPYPAAGLPPPAGQTLSETVPAAPHAPVTAMPTVSMPSMPQVLMTSVYQPPAPAALPPAAQVDSASPLQSPETPAVHSPFVSTSLTVPASVISQQAPAAPTPVPGSDSGRTGILLEARRRGGKPRPMFNVPDAKKNSPNPDLLNMVQNWDERPYRHRGNPRPEAGGYEAGGYEAEDERGAEPGRGRLPPPVAPKPRVLLEAPQIPQAEGKGAELFARRQSRMDLYVVDTPPETSHQQEVPSPSQREPPQSTQPSSQWKYSPNIRAPPPIGYNPLFAPSCPVGPQRDTARVEGKGRGGPQREGIKVLDFMRRQPYQLNSAMFSYGGSAANLSAMPSYQAQQQQGGYALGSSLTPPRQIPIKAARVYEIKRFSTPTPMSAPTLVTKVIAPRSSTTLGEPLSRSNLTSPAPLSPPTERAPFTARAPAPPTALSPPTGRALVLAPMPAKLHPPAGTAGSTSQTVGRLPSLPQISATPIPGAAPIPHPTPYSHAASSYSGFQAAKQFQSAPELSLLANLPPLRTTTVQVPKPRFVATRAGIQPHVWRPGAM